MKRLYYLVAASLALFASQSCLKERDTENPHGSLMKFEAVFDEETRTTYEGAGVVNWSRGDVIRYYSDNFGNVGEYNVLKSGHKTDVLAQVNEGDSFLMAVYGGAEISSNTKNYFILSGAVTAEQNGGFAEAHVAVSRTLDLQNNALLSFKNVTSLVCFSVGRTDVSYITFSANAGEYLHANGKIIVTFPSGNLHSSFGNYASGSSIKVNLNGPGIYYLATLPTTLTQGFRIDYYASDGTLLGHTETTKSQELATNGILNLGLLDTHIKEESHSGGDESGLYLGITGFNSTLSDYPINMLNSETESDFEAFIDGLTMKNGTLLYYSVNDAIDKMQAATCPPDLYNAALITFTDGLDRGTPMMVENYTTNEEYLSYLHDRILNEKVSGQSMTAWSVGIKGQDVSDETQFTNNLNSIASSSSTAYRVNNMAEVNARFQDIAEHLSETSFLQKMALTIPGEATGTRIRFTLDGTSSATASQKYIEGVFNLSSRSLYDITYHGIESSAGDSVAGVVDGIFVTFTFDSIVNLDGDLIVQGNVQEWLYQNGSWVKNSEFEPGEQASVVKEKKSAVVMLNLDCSTSLGDDFATLKAHAKAFIAKLCEATIDDGDRIIITLNESSLSLRTGQTARLIASITPPDASADGIIWTSSNQSVATVSNDGTVSAIASGESIITVSLSTKPAVSASCIVTVVDSPFSSDPIDLSLAVSQLNGKRYYVTQAQFNEADLSEYIIEGICVFASYGNFILSLENASSDEMAYKAASRGFYLPTKEQGRTICARWTDINHAIEAYGGVQLSTSDKYWTSGEWDSGHYFINGSSKSLSYDYDYLPFFVREAIPVSEAEIPFYFMLPSRGLYLSITNGNNRIVLKSSSTIPSGYYPEGLAIETKEDCFILALTDASSDSMSYTSAASTYSDQLPTGIQGRLISARFTDINNALVRFGGSPMPSDRKYWTSAEWASGHCFFKGSGGNLEGDYNYLKYYVRLVLGEWSPPVESIQLNAQELTLSVGSSQHLTATISPSTASSTTLKWHSSLPSVATVDDDGNVMGISEGTSYVTVSTEDGTVSATCKVTVEYRHVESVILDRTSLELMKGNSATLVATVLPEDATNPSLVWTSSNYGIISVNSSGLVTAIAPGSAVITATSVDGGKTASCSVIVKDYIPSAEPIDLSLAVWHQEGDGSNRIAYIPYADLERSGVQEYNYIGLTIVSDNGSFIIAMEDASTEEMRDGAIEFYNFPNEAQGIVISARWNEINSALQLFGGDPLTRGIWTSKKYQSYYYYINGSGGELSLSGSLSGDYEQHVREVLPVDCIPDDGFITKSKGISYFYVKNGQRYTVSDLSLVPSGSSVEGVAFRSTKGVGEGIIALHDAASSKMTWTAAAESFGKDNLPTRQQALLISARLKEVNDALSNCGGDKLLQYISGYGRTSYWSSEGYYLHNIGQQYYILQNGGCILGSDGEGVPYNVRLIIR